VRQQIETYSRKLSSQDRLILSIAFDVDLHNDPLDPGVAQREAARQLYAHQLLGK
jgi:hypothetical protein